MSQDDALAKVCGKEHSGRVRGLGFGPSPSNVFGRSSTFFAAMTSTSTSSIKPQVQQKFQSLESQLQSQLEWRAAMEGALASIFQKMIGTVPDEIANLMSHPSQVNFYSSLISVLFFSMMVVLFCLLL